jgi:hypothetical protein
MTCTMGANPSDEGGRTKVKGSLKFWWETHGDYITEELRRFCERTSIRGVSRILHNRNQVALRYLWTGALIGATAITAYQLWAVLSRYLSYGAYVVIYQEDTSPEFPDVTICKINPYSHPWHDPRQPTLDEYFDLVENVHKAFFYNREDALSKWGLKNDAEVDNILKFLQSPSGYFSNIILSPDELDVSMSTMIVDLGYYSWNLDRYSVDPLKPHGTSFMTSSIVSIFYDPSYQICYQFHLPDAYASSVRALSAIFFVNDFLTDAVRTFDSNIRVSESSGINVVLHERGKFPDPMLGVNVPPGAETTISVKASVSRRLGRPYDECEDFRWDFFDDVYYRDCRHDILKDVILFFLSHRSSKFKLGGSRDF